MLSCGAVTHEQIQLYAKIVAALARERPRAEVLAACGLSEEAFEALEQGVEAELDRAMESDEDGVPAFVLAYERAMHEAQTRTDGHGRELSLDDLARAVRAIEQGGDLSVTFRKLGCSAGDVARAAGAMGERLAKDQDLAVRFEAIRTGKIR